MAKGATRSWSGRRVGAFCAGRLGASDELLVGLEVVFKCSGAGRVSGGSAISFAGGVGGTASDFPNAVVFAVCICSSQTLLSGRARSAYSFSRLPAILTPCIRDIGFLDDYVSPIGVKYTQVKG